MIRLLLRKAAVFLVIAGIVIAAGIWWRAEIKGFFRQSTAGSEKIADSDTSLCYRLPKGRWLEFPLPPWTDHLKILSNAEFSGNTPVPTGASSHYALAYEVISEGGKTIQAGTYHHKTQITVYRVPGREKPTPLNYYVKTPLKPGDGKLIKLNLKPLIERHHVTRLRVKLHAADSSIESVVVRVYGPEYHSGREVSFLWNRLTRKTRQRLAEDNVYPIDFLSAREKQNIVRKLWRPVAPKGVEGQDYERQRLYRFDSRNAVPTEDEGSLPEGLIISPGHRATVPVPPEGWRLRFEIRRLDDPRSKPGQLCIKWYGKEIGRTRRRILSLEESPTVYTDRFAGGLIELWADTRLNIKLYTSENPEKPLDPVDMYLRTFHPLPGRPVVYPVHHSRESRTPFRADFRVTAPHREIPAARVTCELINTAGPNIKRTFRISSPASLYDRLPRQEESAFVSKPESRCFLLPDNISRVRFTSSDNVLVSAYTRPLKLPKTTRVPADYYAMSRHNEGEPTWFLLDPKNYKALYQNRQSVLLTLQYHPPERDPRLLQGIYQWQAFRPSGDWSGAYLFTPRASGQPVRKTALDAAYVPMPLNRPEKLTLQSASQLKVIRPELLCLSMPPETGSIKVFVDGRLHFTHTVTAARGRWSLPPVAPGAHHIRIDAPAGTRAYINHVTSKQADHMLRFANHLGQNGLSFDFLKQTAGEETLSFKLFAPYNNPEESILQVSVAYAGQSKIGPHKKLTVPRRKFLVTPPAESAPVPVMQSEKKQVTTGQPFFFPFGDDLPAGRYRVNIDLVSGPGGYLQMYRVLPGQFVDRTMKKEPILNHETD